MDRQPRPTRTAYHHGDLRAALLQAAEAELTERGIEGFTLRGVAKRAGVSHAAPAHHFRDTNALLTALATEAAERFRLAMEAEQARAAPDAQARLIASGVGYVHFALANPALFDLMFSSKRPDFNDEALTCESDRAFAVLVDGVAALYGGDPLETVEGRIRIANAWAHVHGIAELLIAQRFRFLESDLQSRPAETIRDLVAGVLQSASNIGRPAEVSTSED